MTKRKRVNKFYQNKRRGVPIKKALPNKGVTFRASELFKGRVRVPQTEGGVPLATIPFFDDHGDNIENLYGIFLFTLMERMLFDFINGYSVVYDKKRDLKFYRWDNPVGEKFIKMHGEGYFLNAKMLDLRKTHYTYPRVMMELGYRDRIGASLRLPPYLFNVFLDNIYNGETHLKLSGEMINPDDHWRRMRAVIDNLVAKGDMVRTTPKTYIPKHIQEMIDKKKEDESRD